MKKENLRDYRAHKKLKYGLQSNVSLLNRSTSSPFIFIKVWNNLVCSTHQENRLKYGTYILDTSVILKDQAVLIPTCGSEATF